MGECKQAQSHQQRIAELKDSRLPKTKLEHAAVREIERLEQRLAAAKAKLPKWIPVSERLPKECHAVLICKDGNETSCGYRLSGDWYEENELLAAYNITVTHWMPLPEPPESGRGSDESTV